MRNRHPFVALLLGIGLTVASLWLVARQPVAVRADAGLRFVAPDGDDANDCSSVALRCRTVQRGIEAAAALDEIRVATGVYTETAGTVAEVYKTVRLVGGWAATFSLRDPVAYPTVLNAERRGRVITINGAISPTIDGFVITGGNAHNDANGPDFGGGIYSLYASPVIQNNVISDNYASMGEAQFAEGGGIFVALAVAPVVIRNNRVLSNTGSTNSDGLGGGLYIGDSSAEITDNEIRGNTGGRGAGGALIHQCDGITFAGNLIVHNTATISPGVGGGGGGLYFEYCPSFYLMNNMIAHNAATGSGAGVYLYGYGSQGTSGAAVNNTIADNDGPDAIRMNNDVTLTLTNNIIANHAIGVHTSGGGVISAAYTLFFHNPGGDIVGGGTVASTNAITGTDPLFVNPAQDDYHLQSGSPAVDAGHPAGVPPAPPTDIDGDPRPIGPRVDIGADERRVYEVHARLFLPICRR
jgi:hypothetical protein